MTNTQVSRLFVLLFSTLIALTFAPVPAAAQPGTVLAEQKISDEKGDFDGSLSALDWFGWAVAPLGDIDDDGIPDVAVGAPLDDDGDGLDVGAIWILFLNADGTVRDYQKISDTEGDFKGTIDEGDNFGRSIAAIGDIDGNGFTDLVVGAPFDDDGVGDNRGAVWILFMKDEGKVDDYQKISASSGNFDGTLTVEDGFGASVAAIGDIDKDGFDDIAVGAPFDDDGPGFNVGAVWILFMKDEGKVRDHQKISGDSGRFDGNLQEGDWFGSAVVSPGDLNGDGTNDIVVGSPAQNDGSGLDSGAIWVIFLDEDGKSLGHQKISDEKGELQEDLKGGDFFGFSIGSIGDFNHDGTGDIVVGAPLDDDGGGQDTGAVYLLMLDSTGIVLAEQKISDEAGNFLGDIDEGDSFGNSVTGIGDLDGDGVTELCVGAPFDNDGDGSESGAVWNLFLEGAAPLCGDADANGSVTSTDALIALNAAVGAAECELCRCDVDSNGSITATDSAIVLNAAVGIDVELNCPVCQ
jgi:hypothetical protein